MQTLNEALERMQHSSAQTALMENTSNTPQHGSISGAGNLIIPSNRVDSALPASSHQGQLSPAKPRESLQNSLHSPKEKAQLTLAMGQICELQKQYGKTSPNLKTIVEGFLWILKDFSMVSILEALAQYVRTHSDIPTPSDIVKILDPQPVEWKPDWAVYIGLKQKVQKEGYYLWGKEKEFVKKCDEYAISRALAADRTPEEIQAHKVATGLINFSSER